MFINAKQVKRICNEYRASKGYIDYLNIQVSEMIEKSKCAIKSSKRTTLMAEDVEKGLIRYRNGIPGGGK